MLSILIPIYNVPVFELVEALHQQGMQAKISFEIRCYDDASQPATKQQNKEIKKLSGVVYKELPFNLGRSKIRNELGKDAIFEHLLFIDADSKVVATDYISKYLHNLNGKQVLYGGTAYFHPKPARKELHWKAGYYREQVSSSKRNLNPYRLFTTNNFLIEKTLFHSVWFDQSISKYGHEDTLFAAQLKDRNIPIFHLDNPVEHTGLETTEIFLKKSKIAIENLRKIVIEHPYIKTRLLETFYKLESWGMSNWVAWLYRLSEKKVLKNLHSSNPNLKLFDWYKLAVLIELSRKE